MLQTPCLFGILLLDMHTELEFLNHVVILFYFWEELIYIFLISDESFYLVIVIIMGMESTVYLFIFGDGALHCSPRLTSNSLCNQSYP